MSTAPFQINEREWRALFDEPHHLFKVYAAIRQFMNYETGISGLHPYRFSEQFFRELLYVEPRPGRSKALSGSPTKKEIYYSLDALAKIVCREDHKTPLIISRKDLGHFVFELPLASRDTSAQKQWGTNGELMGDAIGNKDKTKKPSKSKMIQEEVEYNGGHNISDYSAQCGTPPDIRNTKEVSKDTSSPSQARAHGSRLHEDWTLPDDWRTWAEDERPDLDIDKTAEIFKDHWLGKPGKEGRKADWLATWRNWVRREKRQVAKRHTHETDQRPYRSAQSANEAAIRQARERRSRESESAAGVVIEGKWNRVRG